MSLQPPDEKGPNCLGGEGRSIHELMHALGIFHEHSRADRDEYISVKFENIIPGETAAYTKKYHEEQGSGGRRGDRGVVVISQHVCHPHIQVMKYSTLKSSPWNSKPRVSVHNCSVCQVVKDF